MHGAAIVIKFHFEMCGADARGLTRALPGAAGKARRPKRYPTEQSKTEGADRDGNTKLATEREEPGKQHGSDTAKCSDQTCGLLGIDLGKCVDRPQREKQNDNTKDNFRHGYLSCSRSRTAPAFCRCFKSAKAFMPPAA